MIWRLLPLAIALAALAWIASCADGSATAPDAGARGLVPIRVLPHAPDAPPTDADADQVDAGEHELADAAHVDTGQGELSGERADAAPDARECRRYVDTDAGRVWVTGGCCVCPAHEPPFYVCCDNL